MPRSNNKRPGVSVLGLGVLKTYEPDSIATRPISEKKQTKTLQRRTENDYKSREIGVLVCCLVYGIIVYSHQYKSQYLKPGQCNHTSPGFSV